MNFFLHPWVCNDCRKSTPERFVGVIMEVELFTFTFWKADQVPIVADEYRLEMKFQVSFFLCAEVLKF